MKSQKNPLFSCFRLSTVCVYISTGFFSFFLPSLVWASVFLNDGKTLKLDKLNPSHNNTDYVINHGTLDLNHSDWRTTSLSGEGGSINFGYSNTTLMIDQREDTIYKGKLEGFGGYGKIIKSGSGTLSLEGDNGSYDGLFFLNEGVVSISKSNNLASSWSYAGIDTNLNFNGGTLRNTGDAYTQWKAHIGPQGAIFETKGNLVIENISGEGKLIKEGEGLLAIQGPPSDGSHPQKAFTGDIELKAGLLSIPQELANNTSGYLIINGGTLKKAGAFFVKRNIILDTKGGKFQVEPDYSTLGPIPKDSVMTIESNIQGPGALHIGGDLSAALNLAGNNTYEGGTFLQQSRVVVSQDKNLGHPSGSFTFEGGDLKVIGAFSTARNFVFQPVGGVFAFLPATFDLQQDLSIEGVISGKEGFAKKGPGTLTLLANNTHSGNMSITGGALSVFREENLGAPSVNLALLDCTFRNMSPFTTEHLFEILNRVVFDNQADLTIKKEIIGMGDLEKRGPAVLTLAHRNSYIGKTIIQQGILSVSQDENLGLDTPQQIPVISQSREATPFIRETMPLKREDIHFYTMGGAQEYENNPLVSETEALLLESFALKWVEPSVIFKGGTLRNTAAFSTHRPMVLSSEGGTFDTQAKLTVHSSITGPGALTKTGAGTLTLSADNTYGGDTFIQQGTLSVNGSIHSNALISSGATLSGTGTLFGHVTNRGILSPGNSIGTLTIQGDYKGEGGILQIETIPGTGIADQLIITGHASGTTLLDIVHLPGLGAPLPAQQDVEIIKVGSSTPDAFVLTSPQVGAYNYNLVRSAGGWNLQSLSLLPPTLQIIAPTTSAAQRKGLRVATQVYPFAPFLMQEYTANAIGTHHQRSGAQVALQQQETSNSSSPGVIWSRFLGSGGRLNAYGNFQYTLQAFQIGSDLYRILRENGTRDHVGIYGIFGKGEGRVATEKLRLGDQRLEAPGLGAYWTHYGTKNQYLDVVLQAAYYSNTLKTFIENNSLSLDAKGYVASIEGGYPLKIQNLTLEPQAQLIYQRLGLHTYQDRVSTLSFEEPNALRGRIGLRIPHETTLVCSKGRRCDLTIALTGNIWRELLANHRVTFRTLQGAYPLCFSPNLKGTWTDIGVEGTLGLSRHMDLYANGNYAYGWNHAKRKTVGGSLGVRLHW